MITVQELPHCNGTQQEEPKTDITVVDKAEVVKNVAVDENAVIKNAAGETVNPGEVSVVIEKSRKQRN